MTEAELGANRDERRNKVRAAGGKAQASLTLLVGLLVLVTLAALGLLVLQSVDIRENQGRTRVLVEAQERQARDIKQLLAIQADNDANRSTRIAAAVAQIAAEQRKALAEHDARVEKLLRRTLLMTEAELNGANNQELIPPMSLEAQPASQAKLTPTPAVGPAPKPAPPPCRPLGRSGRCAK